MKSIKTILFGALALMIVSCNSNSGKLLPGISQKQVDSASTAIGVAFAGMLKGSGIETVNYAKIMSAMKAAMAGDTTLMFKEENAGMYIQEYMMATTAAMGKVREQEEKDFFAKNKNNEGVMETESGLQYRIDVPGSEVKPTSDMDTVEVNYKGSLLNGKVFDSSYDRGETVKFPLNGVIKGWTEGLKLIGEGGKATLWIPFNMAYGERAMGPDLPAYSTLQFDVELIKVMKYIEPKQEEKK